MHPIILFASFAIDHTAGMMCSAGIAVFVIGIWAARSEIAGAPGLKKVVAVTTTCFAVPLAIFGTLHLCRAQSIQAGVPPYMPWRIFWAYAVGCALIAAALSLASRIAVRWSGLLFGIMMVAFIGMIHFPNAVRTPHDRIAWTIIFREMSFGGGGLVLAGIAMGASRGYGKILVIVGRVLIAIAAIFFGVQHFLHPLGLPAVPLKKEMPAWIPARAFIDYLTGTFLIVAGLCFLLARRMRLAATCLGSWIVLLVLIIYGPVMIAALGDPSSAVQIEGLNYFADTLLFGAVILSLARAMTASDNPVDSDINATALTPVGVA